MPVFKVVAVYKHIPTGLNWSVVNHTEAADYDAAFALLDAWNSAYMQVVNPDVAPFIALVSDVALYRDIRYFPKAEFSDQAGAVAGAILPLSVAALLSLTPAGGRGAVSHRWLHGLRVAFTTPPDILQTASPTVAALVAASLEYFQLYRKSATAHYPAIPAPEDFEGGFFEDTLYDRRLGSPLVFSGQTQRFLPHRA